MNDQARAFLIVGALLSGVSGSGGFAGGRWTAPVPPAEVRFIPIFSPVLQAPAEAAPIEPTVPVAPVVDTPIEPPAAIVAPVEAKPLPPPRPKIEAKPKEQTKPQKPRSSAPAKKALPSCAAVKREYATMTWAQQMAAYRRATPEQIAYGRRCLGL